MSAFNPGQIPASVTTIEQLHAWSGSVLAQINSATRVATNPNTLEAVAQAQTFNLVDQAENPERLVVLTYLPLVPNWRAAGSLYVGVGEISSSAVPAGFQA